MLPSSNSVLEPLVARLPPQSEATFHFSRLGVIDITLDPASLAQFTLQGQVAVGALLCDAEVDCVVWGGTSASWLGVDHDFEFCKMFTETTGVPAGSCVLEINRFLASRRVKTFGLVTPYTTEVQQKIIDNYQCLGFSCVGEQHYGGALSNDYATIDPNADRPDGARRGHTRPRRDFDYVYKYVRGDDCRPSDCGNGHSGHRQRGHHLASRAAVG